MYSQKNVLQVFVSPFDAPQTVVDVKLADLADGEIGFFDTNTDLTIASGEGYFAYNKGGIIQKSNPVSDFSWDVKAYAAPVAKVETVTIPAIVVEGEWYQVDVLVHSENNNGDEVKKGQYKAKAGDDQAAVTTAVLASIQASISRDEVPNLSVAAGGAGEIVITGLRWAFKVGRKGFGQVDFSSSISKPSDVAADGVATTVISQGIGDGQYINSKEFFYLQNHDAVSINEFRTALPKDLVSNPALTYNVQAVNSVWKEFGLSDHAKGLPRQVLLAFDANGGSPSTPTP